LSANLSLALAERGCRVLLVDADLGGANLHTVLGVPPPRVSVSDFLSRHASLDEVAVSTPYQNLRLVSGAHDDMFAANPHHASKMRLLRQLAGYDTDYVVLDLGAGTSFNMLDFFLIANFGVLVVLPEPTSVENAYRFLKAAFFRRLAVVEKTFGIGDLIAQARSQRTELGLRTPADLIRAVVARDPEVGKQLEEQMSRFVPRLVLNQVSHEHRVSDERVASDMAFACKRFLGIRLDVLGTMPEDDAVRRCVRQRKPLWVAEPESPARRAMESIVSTLLASRNVTERAA
jgi:flagellar biosynthesis protein FlhG